MKAILVMFDSLNRQFLSAYGNNWTHTPNFRRLAGRAVTFDTSYVCSMPCMPARRDLHTGRPNFLHRSWGPLEPWDTSCVANMRHAGIHTHIVTDHQHYWEPGAGGNYLFQYNTHDMVRGQEGDPWYGDMNPAPPHAKAIHRNAQTDPWTTQDRINRTRIHGEAEMPQARTFSGGLDFIERHAKNDNWFLQIETFDPHEPFFTQPAFKEMYAEHYEKARDALWDWPAYGPVSEAEDEVRLMRLNYAALVSMCDTCLGKVLDAMDRHQLWEDTLLIVCTDHGFLLGEQDCWAKCWMPFYEEIARTPFFIWDPRHPVQGGRRSSLVQPAIDIGPTVLDWFGLDPLPHATGKNLAPVVADDTAVRGTAVFGMFGAQVNITDGNHVYMRGVDTEAANSLNEYTLMPAHMRASFKPEELQDLELAEPFSFTRGVRPLRVPCRNAWRGSNIHPDRLKTLLYDVKRDPAQRAPIDDPGVEERFLHALHGHLTAVDAPAEQWRRLGLRPRWSK